MANKVKQRVEQELVTLQGNTQRLDYFLSLVKNRDKVGATQCSLMYSQVDAMNSYAHILTRRLEEW